MSTYAIAADGDFKDKRMTSPAPADYETVCGETYDHAYEVTSQDDDLIVYVCRRCGAETWEDIE